MSNIDKQARQVQRFANYGVNMMEWADGGYVKHSDYQALLDELEAKDARIAKLSNERATGVEKLQSELIQARIRAEAAEKRITEMEGESTVTINEMSRIIQQVMKAKREAVLRTKSAEKRIAELEAREKSLRTVGVMSQKAFQRLEGRESRFIALWPRPEIYLPRKRPEDGVIVYARVAGTGKESEHVRANDPRYVLWLPYVLVR